MTRFTSGWTHTHFTKHQLFPRVLVFRGSCTAKRTSEETGWCEGNRAGEDTAGIKLFTVIDGDELLIPRKLLTQGRSETMILR